MKINKLFLLAMLFIAACSPITITESAPTEIANQDQVLSASVLANSAYHSPDWGDFQLTDGVYFRPPPTSLESPDAYTTHLRDQIYGDINADGLEDALVFLSTQNGGTGHLLEMAAVLNQNGSPANISTVSLGDRVIVESSNVENGVITLNMIVQGPNDGLCCPSQHVTWKFMLVNGQLSKLE